MVWAVANRIPLSFVLPFTLMKCSWTHRTPQQRPEDKSKGWRSGWNRHPFPERSRCPSSLEPILGFVQETQLDNNQEGWEQPDTGTVEKTSVLVRSGHYNGLPETGGVYKQQILLLTVPEAGKPKIKPPAGFTSGEGPLPGSKTVVFLLCLTWPQGHQSSLGPLS